MTVKEQIVNNILLELEKAEEKHPFFPDDLVHMVAIMAEEAGEATRASLQICYESRPIGDLELELAQTAAMCIRNLYQIRVEGYKLNNGYHYPYGER